MAHAWDDIAWLKLLVSYMHFPTGRVSLTLYDLRTKRKEDVLRAAGAEMDRKALRNI